MVPVDNPEGLNVVLGQSHFIKTVEDLHEAVVGTCPQAHFGLAFCEASGPRLVRCSGNDEALVQLAAKNALELGAGHLFVLFLRDAYPVNVLNAIKQVPEVCRIFCASANPLSVVLAAAGEGRAVLGVADGASPLGVETGQDVVARKQLLRSLGYKL